MKIPPGNEPCFTFNVFPDAPFTQGLDPSTLTDYRNQHVPYVESSCGFVPCPGWPMTPAENSDNTTLCCKKIADAPTQGRNAGRCRAPDLCLGKCSEDENGNIPGGHGGCVFTPFDPSKAKLIGTGGGQVDCTMPRVDSSGGMVVSASSSAPLSNHPTVVDPCRGAHTLPEK